MLIFNLGERRHILVDIYNCKNSDFEIQEATYELIYNDTKEIEESGVCSVYEHRLDAVIEPKNQGEYTLEITYKVLDETLIEPIGIAVM